MLRDQVNRDDISALTPPTQNGQNIPTNVIAATASTPQDTVNNGASTNNISNLMNRRVGAYVTITKQISEVREMKTMNRSNNLSR